jgi:NTE family protein
MSGKKKISLGLQGGGAYGAFGWGVLDRLLADDRLEIEAIGASSAGAINAVALADGYALGGGAAGARRSLDKFWNTLGQTALLSSMRPSPLDALKGRGSIESSAGYMLMQLASAGPAPGVVNPLNINPLVMLLAGLIDFERVRACTEMELFVCATNLRTGKGRNFLRAELTVKHVMASACLPQVYAPVVIDGEPYWDGSFVGNPPLAPLVDHGTARDLLVVMNNPIARSELPVSMADVHNRSNEISFNIALVREISAIQHMAAALDEENVERVHRCAVRLHAISGTGVLRDLSLSSKFNMDWGFILRLRDLGREAAERWLRDDFDGVGVVSTFDPVQVYAPETLPVGG